jgi:hypothetical protein
VISGKKAIKKALIPTLKGTKTTLCGTTQIDAVASTLFVYYHIHLVDNG